MTKRFPARHAVSLACDFRRKPIRTIETRCPSGHCRTACAGRVDGRRNLGLRRERSLRRNRDSRREPTFAGRRTIRPSSSIPTSTASRTITASMPTIPSPRPSRFYYTNSEGELTIGTATPDPDGKTLHPRVRHHASGWQDRAHPLHGRARRKRCLLVHRLHAEGWRVGAGVQDSLRAEVSQFCAAILV